MECRTEPGHGRLHLLFFHAPVAVLLVAQGSGLAQAEVDGVEALVVAGGVAANSSVRGALESLAAEQGLRFVAPPLWLCTDNAAMIAWAGAERFSAGLTDPLDVAARARWPLDPDAERVRGAGVKA